MEWMRGITPALNCWIVNAPLIENFHRKTYEAEISQFFYALEIDFWNITDYNAIYGFVAQKLTKSQEFEHFTKKHAVFFSIEDIILIIINQTTLHPINGFNTWHPLDKPSYQKQMLTEASCLLFVRKSTWTLFIWGIV